MAPVPHAKASAATAQEHIPTHQSDITRSYPLIARPHTDLCNSRSHIEHAPRILTDQGDHQKQRIQESGAPCTVCPHREWIIQFAYPRHAPISAVIGDNERHPFYRHRPHLTSMHSKGEGIHRFIPKLHGDTTAGRYTARIWSPTPRAFKHSVHGPSSTSHTSLSHSQVTDLFAVSFVNHRSPPIAPSTLPEVTRHHIR
jgi:hypothetical protein